MKNDIRAAALDCYRAAKQNPWEMSRREMSTDNSDCDKNSSVSTNSNKVAAHPAKKHNFHEGSVLLTPVSSTVCRICQTSTLNETLISPCNCKGSLKYVHLSCLERWLNQSSRSYCELCMYHYNSIQTQRYGLCEGLLLWIRHPRNRTHIQSDFLITILLTIVSVGLVLVCLMGMQYFVIEGKKLGISEEWTSGGVYIFLTVIIGGYFITMYLVIKDQLMPWYVWWKNTVDVRLLLSPSVAEGIAIITRQGRETRL